MATQTREPFRFIPGPAITLVALMAIVPGGFANAQSTSEATPSGTWKWSSEIDGQTINSVLTLEAEGKEVTGSYKDQNIEAEIEEGKFEDGKLSFEMSAELQGQDLHAAFVGKVADATIDGEVSLEYDGEQLGDYDWTPDRHVGNEQVVGTWNFEFTDPQGTKYTPALVVEEKDGKLGGVISVGNDEFEVESLKITDNSVTFNYTGDYNGNDIDLSYDCQPRGNKLTGKLDYDLNGNTGEIKVTAVRKQLSKQERALLGEWHFALTTPDGQERTSVLTLSDDAGTLAAKLKGDGKEFEVENFRLEEGEILFDFTNNHDGLIVDLSWSSKLEGDKMKGEIWFDADGNTGEVPLDGTRK